MKGFLIISIPRSGSNLLRDTLVKNFTQLYTLQCDEIPYFWRYVEGKGPEFLSKQLSLLFTRNTGIFIEKTCENVLRRDYLLNSLPHDIGIILLSRSSKKTRDSIIRMWLDSNKGFRYKLKKLLCLPLKYKIISLVGAVSSRFILPKSYWGPRVPDVIDSINNGMSIEKAARMQHLLLEEEFTKWLELYEIGINSDRFFHVSYENLISHPDKVLTTFAEKYGLKVPKPFVTDHILNLTD